MTVPWWIHEVRINWSGSDGLPAAYLVALDEQGLAELIERAKELEKATKVREDRGTNTEHDAALYEAHRGETDDVDDRPSRSDVEREEVRESWCAVIGGPIEGLILVGPFSSSDEATDYMEHQYPNETWWVTDMVIPDPSEGTHDERLGREYLSSGPGAPISQAEADYFATPPEGKP